MGAKLGRQIPPNKTPTSRSEDETAQSDQSNDMAGFLPDIQSYSEEETFHFDDMYKKISAPPTRREFQAPLFRLRKPSTVNLLTGLKTSHCETALQNWNVVTSANPKAFGMGFLMKFFRENPDYRNFFPTLRGEGDSMDLAKNEVELAALQTSLELEEIALMFMDGMSTILNLLDNQQELTHILYNLTDRHVPRGILSLHFQDILSLLLVYIEEQTGRSKMTTMMRDSWTIALRTIITIIDERYNAIRHKKPLQNPQ